MDQSNDWLLWQLVDSAFPTGGFAHSAGLEAACQHGEVRAREELASYLEAQLHQTSRSVLPFVTSAFDAPERVGEFDGLCDAFTSNHVANRASRLQGRAFWTVVDRIFGSSLQVKPRESSATPPHMHFAPLFGALMKELRIPRPKMIRLFLFNHLRALLAAAVRLNIAGPMEAQTLQHRYSRQCEEIACRCENLTLDDLAQTSPLLDIWQGTHDRLYSRLFQS